MHLKRKMVGRKKNQGFQMHTITLILDKYKLQKKFQENNMSFCNDNYCSDVMWGPVRLNGTLERTCPLLNPKMSFLHISRLIT